MNEASAKTAILLLEMNHPDGSMGRYAKHDLEIDGVGPYQGRILQCTPLRREVPARLEGFIRSSITLRLADTDRLFSDMDARGWLNRTATLKLAFIPAPAQEVSSRVFSDAGERILVDGAPVFLTPPHATPPPAALFKNIFTGTLADYQYAEGVFVVTLKSMDHLWMDRTFQTRITKEAFPNAPASSLGAIIPIVYGEIRGEAG